jgi:hypothetical protein
MLGRGGRLQLTFPEPTHARTLTSRRRLDPRLWNRKNLSRMRALWRAKRPARKAPLRAGLEVLGVVQINDNSSMSVQCGPSMTHKGRPGA